MGKTIQVKAGMRKGKMVKAHSRTLKTHNEVFGSRSNKNQMARYALSDHPDDVKEGAEFINKRKYPKSAEYREALSYGDNGPRKKTPLGKKPAGYKGLSTKDAIITHSKMIKNKKHLATKKANGKSSKK